METAKNAVKSMESSMTADQIKRARNEAEREILSIRLSELRERRGIKQSEMGSFSQTAVSKLERRKDMKLSTLIEYLDGIGMGLELRVYPKETNGISETEMLLKV
ncbi:helix-turn-helix domain-containing protein [Treponema zuelzerae]|uniref:Helix-turn-helix domain-containing protein n=1 Tax=Teretinema zuelzerae TaxID=156 RepID=A0AAE3EG59_9SPIR|nr:helix-turn-helix domain-containing protein [Teretinema zuelzerae]MCD1653565.1 helix-turn-helix domain-containing protein [Teretinema zuelzerae]